MRPAATKAKICKPFVDTRRKARTGCNPAGLVPMQLRYETGLAGEHYVTGELWRLARLDRCPLHPRGGCGLARHGTYARKTPAGTLIARWYCPLGHSTFSLLPDHLAARFPGTLQGIEQVVAAAEGTGAGAPSLQSCADALRPDPVTLPSAMRWLRRRLVRVRPLLRVAVSMAPQRLLGCPPTIAGLRERLGAVSGQDCALVRLRELLARHLPTLAFPLGFGHRAGRGGEEGAGLQQHMGPDPPVVAA